MTFVVEPARTEDLADFISVIFAAHDGTEHFINVAYPDNLTQAGQAAALKKFQDASDAADIAVWEKATDTVTGKIVGVAIWATFTTHKPGENPYATTDAAQAVSRKDEYVKELGASIAKIEAGFWGENELPLTSLSVLAVDPAYQRKGVGTLLMKSGFKHADSIGAKVSVISSDKAGGFYPKLGFRVECHTALEVGERFSKEEEVWVWFLVRQRVQNSSKNLLSG